MLTSEWTDFSAVKIATYLLACGDVSLYPTVLFSSLGPILTFVKYFKNNLNLCRLLSHTQLYCGAHWMGAIPQHWDTGNQRGGDFPKPCLRLP